MPVQFGPWKITIQKSPLIRTTRLETNGRDGGPQSYQANYLDYNGDHRYNEGDSVLISDINGDGKYDYKDAETTSKLLNLMKNRRDPNLDNSPPGPNSLFGGGSSDAERKEAVTLRPLLSKLDPSGNGCIERKELPSSQPGIKNLRLARDLNGDGQFSGEDFAPERTQDLQTIVAGLTTRVNML